MTSVIKSGSTFYESDGVLGGTAYQPQTIIAVRWQWLILIMVYVVLAIIFLSSVIWWTYASGVRPLKSSSLAIMLAPNGELKQALGSLDEANAAKKKAQTTQVKLSSSSSANGLHLTYTSGT
jgi:uncharacterized SAM-binding protein YcdF (DUF218 family)